MDTYFKMGGTVLSRTSDGPFMLRQENGELSSGSFKTAFACNVVIYNDGVGPALKVTQLGSHPIADFYDDIGMLAMRVADGGNVGIGTSTPQQALHVQARSYFVGNVGIGTANPATALHVRPNTSTTGVIIDQVGAGAILDVRDGGVSKFVVDAQGNVGIGTATPKALLHMIGDIRCPVFTGMIAYFAMDAVPTGWLLCNGSIISRSTYASLFSVIGTTYGVGDGLLTFGIPDLRGEFIRGADKSRGVDTGRVVGTYQAQSVEQHTHWISSAAIDDRNFTGTGGNGQEYGLVSDAGFYSDSDPNKSSGRFTRYDPPGNTETRPRNIALLACIKY